MKISSTRLFDLRAFNKSIPFCGCRHSPCRVFGRVSAYPDIAILSGLNPTFSIMRVATVVALKVLVPSYFCIWLFIQRYVIGVPVHPDSVSLKFIAIPISPRKFSSSVQFHFDVAPAGNKNLKEERESRDFWH
ncbi:MAG: hypothetical protein CM1200mP28_08540 [Deltaproteobacteria bacterium]|nr:MAG: hypothetical protein CM1200mP28_08540 [Deltaproteobacteria bacterium]